MENKQINNPSRSELITDFVKSNPEYYIKEFQKLEVNQHSHFHLIYMQES